MDEIDPRFPIQEVSTGLRLLMVPLRHLETVKHSEPKWDLFTQLTMRACPRAILVFCPETESAEIQLHARGFTQACGIPEDPATGTTP